MLATRTSFPQLFCLLEHPFRLPCGFWVCIFLQNPQVIPEQVVQVPHWEKRGSGMPWALATESHPLTDPFSKQVRGDSLSILSIQQRHWVSPPCLLLLPNQASLPDTQQAKMLRCQGKVKVCSQGSSARKQASNLPPQREGAWGVHEIKNKEGGRGDSLAVQWLGLHAFTAELNFCLVQSQLGN